MYIYYVLYYIILYYIILYYNIRLYLIMLYIKYLILPKIHKRLHNVPGRAAISNSGYYTENISSLLDHHLEPLAQLVKSYIKELTNS